MGHRKKFRPVATYCIFFAILSLMSFVIGLNDDHSFRAFCRGIRPCIDGEVMDWNTVLVLGLATSLGSLVFTFLFWLDHKENN